MPYFIVAIIPFLAFVGFVGTVYWLISSRVVLLGPLTCPRAPMLRFMDGIVAVAGGALVGLIGGLALLVYLRGTPNLRAWSPFVLLFTLACAAVLTLAVVPPLALWTMLGNP